MAGIWPDLAGVGRESSPVHHLTSREHGEQGRTNANSPRGRARYQTSSTR